jgi:hypothetical protein
MDAALKQRNRGVKRGPYKKSRGRWEGSSNESDDPPSPAVNYDELEEVVKRFEEPGAVEEEMDVAYSYVTPEASPMPMPNSLMSELLSVCEKELKGEAADTLFPVMESAN